MNQLIEIFESIKSDNLNKVLNLLSSNPSCLNQYLYGVTPFLYAIECGNEKIALELCTRVDADLTLKDNLMESCLDKCLENKMYNLIELICKNNKAIKLDEILCDKETLLTRSIKNDDNNASIALINGGANLNKPNGLNQYPLQIAINLNKIVVVKEILKNNDTYLNTHENGYNPLLDACEKELTEIAILLIENGADVNVQDKDQYWSPIMHSISNNNEIITLKLLEKQCDLSNVDLEGNNVVHLAVITENEYLLKYILKHNPNKNWSNKNNQTPLDLAKLSEDEILIQMLS